MVSIAQSDQGSVNIFVTTVSVNPSSTVTPEHLSYLSKIFRIFGIISQLLKAFFDLSCKILSVLWLPCTQCTELVFVDLLRSPRIDSQSGGPVRQPYLSYRPDRLHRLAKPIPRNRFLGSINVYKYRLWSVLWWPERGGGWGGMGGTVRRKKII